MEQGSHEWLMARCGLITASRFKDVMGRVKNGSRNADGKKYLIEIIAERLTGNPAEHFVNPAMKWGTEMEPRAREAYCRTTGRTVDQIGFVRHPTLPAGASPDGIIDVEGLLEIKCPTTATHLATLMNGMDEEHQCQIQGQMWVTGMMWADFVSYDPRLPIGMDLYIQRVPRDEAFIATLQTEIVAFDAEIEATIKTLKEKTK